MIHAVLHGLLAVSLAWVLYAYLGYPLLLLLIATFKQVTADILFGLGKRNRRRRGEAGLPSISLIFAAHNEAGVIEQKMLNCKRLVYPADRLEILVGCDGCTDGTAELARRADVPNALILEFRERGGKPATLNQLVPMAKGEIAVFCDANTMFEPETLISLARHFERQEIGCVCGELRLVDAGKKRSTEGIYWKYETMLKFLESRLNMLVGANGGVFAIRRKLFTPLPPDGIIDDFLVAMRIRAEGHRVVYDPEAVAIEEVAEGVQQEFKRRVRIGAGNFHALRYTWQLLNPARGLIALAYWSHKVCRWLVPIALCMGAVSAAVLSVSDPGYLILIALGAVFGGLGYAGYRLDQRGWYWTPASVPYYFLSMNLALLMGFIRFLRQSQSTVWNPTPRQPILTGGGNAASEDRAQAKEAHV
jgi:cellulose synthase/poly-beta-1,6-N-acetylglucosamine synthase-like glycosyltransferase